MKDPPEHSDQCGAVLAARYTAAAPVIAKPHTTPAWRGAWWTRTGQHPPASGGAPHPLSGRLPLSRQDGNSLAGTRNTFWPRAGQDHRGAPLCIARQTSETL